MSRDKNRCIDPAFYTPHARDAAFDGARAILLARYSEKELDSALEHSLQEHLSRCESCSALLKDLTEGVSPQFPDETWAYAVCPSSSSLDRYVFAQSELVAEERARIELHMQECPMCVEETEWLKQIKPPEEAISFSKRKANWTQYAAVAAALLFMALSTFLLIDRLAIRKTEESLRSAAVIKEPQDIDYIALQTSSVPLPEKMDGIYRKGVEALKGRRFQEAIRHLELVATAHPDHSGAIFLMGYSYYQMNEPQRAFELCDQAEKIAPHSLERCLSLVNIALKTGHYERALEEISGLYHAAPDHPEIKRTYDRIRAISRGRALRL